LTLDLGKKIEVNRLLLQEYIPLGQRVKLFSVDYWDGNKFIELDKQTTIGYKRILTFATISTDKVRINMLGNAEPVISEIQVYKADEILESPVITRDNKGVVSIKSLSPDPIITYTTDGTDPVFTSKRYQGMFDLKNGGIVKARAFINNGKNFSDVIAAEYDLSTGSWEVLKHSDSQKGYNVENAFDGNPRTNWVSSKELKSTSNEISIDMGEALEIDGFTYTPVVNENQSGNIYTYSFYTSMDGVKWNNVVSNNAFGNIKNNPIKQRVKFKKKISTRFIKLEALSQVDENSTWIAIADIGVIVD